MDRRDFTKGIVGMGVVLFAGSSAVAGVRYLYDLVRKDEALPVIKLVGVGSAGCRAVEGLMGRHFNASDCLLISRESSDLERAEGANRIFLQEIEPVSSCVSCSDEKIALMIGRVFHSYEKAILAALQDADLIIIMAGMGWLTGTMAAPLTAELCRSIKMPVTAVVSTPFPWEGEKPIENAALGLNELKKHTDHLLELPLKQCSADGPCSLTVPEAFAGGVNTMQEKVLHLMGVVHT